MLSSTNTPNPPMSPIMPPISSWRREMSDRPYKMTPVFDEMTLPSALRNAHSTKAGVWGVIRVLDGAVRYYVGPQPETSVLLTPGNPVLIEPQQAHRVEPHGPMRMQVEFYDHRPTHNN